MANNQDMEQGREWRQMRRNDALSTLTWALIFIWAGVVLLAENLGYLSWLHLRFSDMPLGWRQFGMTSWPLIFLGAGVLVLVEAVLRLILPAFRRPIVGQAILAVIFIGIGLGNLTNWALIWPAILIVLGVAMLAGGVFRNR